MRVYYRDSGVSGQGILIGTHEDSQTIDPSVYGDGVKLLILDTQTPLERIGEPGDANGIDIRPIRVPTVTLDSAKTEAVAKVFTILTGASASILSVYPQSEVLSWGTKEVAARLQLAKEPLSSAQTAMLTAELSARGGTMEDLCNSILANADIFATISGFLSGLRTKTTNDIMAATTPAQINTIIDGLPAIIQSKLSQI